MYLFLVNVLASTATHDGESDLQVGGRGKKGMVKDVRCREEG